MPSAVAIHDAHGCACRGIPTAIDLGSPEPLDALSRNEQRRQTGSCVTSVIWVIRRCFLHPVCVIVLIACVTRWSFASLLVTNLHRFAPICIDDGRD